MSNITFSTIKNELDVNELYRMKIQLTEDTSEFHIKLENRDFEYMTRSELLRDINGNKELIDYLNTRIKDRKQEIYIDEKEQRYHLKQFKDAARARLEPELFKELETESRKI